MVRKPFVLLSQPRMAPINPDTLTTPLLLPGQSMPLGLTAMLPPTGVGSIEMMRCVLERQGALLYVYVMVTEPVSPLGFHEVPVTPGPLQVPPDREPKWNMNASTSNEPDPVFATKRMNRALVGNTIAAYANVVELVDAELGDVVQSAMSDEDANERLAVLALMEFMRHRMTTVSPAGIKVPRSTTNPAPALPMDAKAPSGAPIMFIAFEAPPVMGTAVAFPAVCATSQVVRSMGPLVWQTAAGARNVDGFMMAGPRTPAWAFATKAPSLFVPVRALPGMLIAFSKLPARATPPKPSAATPQAC